MDPARLEARSVAGALLRLAAAGYARRVEVVRGRAWCGSCQAWFEPEDLIADIRVVVDRDGPGGATAVYGLRCPSCGAGAAWVVGEEEQAAEFLARLSPSPSPDRSKGPPDPSGYCRRHT